MERVYEDSGEGGHIGEGGALTDGALQLEEGGVIMKGVTRGRAGGGEQ